jgi:hypothetical protein
VGIGNGRVRSRFDGRQGLIGRGDIGHGIQAMCGEYSRYQYTRIQGSIINGELKVRRINTDEDGSEASVAVPTQAMHW